MIFGALAATACSVNPAGTEEPSGAGDPGGEADVESGARVAAASFTLTLSVTGNGVLATEGTGLTCRTGTCTFSVPANTVVRVHEVTGAGASFLGWSGECSGSVITICSVRMTRDVSIGGAFSP